MQTVSKRSRLKNHRRALRSMSETGCFVYTLAEAIDGLPVYVGQTRSPLDDRLKNHLKEAVARERAGQSLSPVYRWILDKLSAGQMPVIRMLDEKATWDITEAVWIDRYTRQGLGLLNIVARVR